MIEQRIGDPRLRGLPCVGCKRSSVCADLELACRDFGLWVAGMSHSYNAEGREPSRAIFNRVMKREW